MKALVFDNSKSEWETSRGFELRDVPKPVLDSDGQVLIKVHYAGVCGTDKGIWKRQAMRDQILGSFVQEVVIASEAKQSQGREIAASPPKADPRNDKTFRVLGHEFFGEIVEVGKQAAKEYKLKVGDFVSCESHVVCNKCYQCVHGEKQVCTNEKILGISHDGCFAEYIKVPGRIVWKTDTAKIRPEVAAMQEPFGNAVHAASKTDLKEKTIAIFGLGPIGLFLLLVAKGMGAKNIIGIEPNPVAIEMANQLGIDYVIPLKVHPHPASSIKGEEKEKHSSSLVGGVRGGGDYQHDPKVAAEIMKITGGLGVDISFEMSGFNDSLNNAIFSTRRGGDVILFGLKTEDFVLQDYNRLIVRGLTLHAVIGRKIWETWKMTKNLLEEVNNGIQEQMFKVILNQGNGTILPIAEYSKDRFEKMMAEHPKFLIQM